MPEEDRGVVPRLFAADAISGELRDAVRSGQFEYVVISRSDGLVIGHNLPDTARAKRVAAMSAAVVGTAIMASAELDRGRLKLVHLEGDDGHIFCLSAGPEAIVAGLAPIGADMDVVIRALGELARHIREALDEWSRPGAR